VILGQWQVARVVQNVNMSLLVCLVSSCCCITSSW